VKKACTACGKQIPSSALDCVFCGAKQPALNESTPEMVMEAQPTPMASPVVVPPASSSVSTSADAAPPPDLALDPPRIDARPIGASLVDANQNKAASTAAAELGADKGARPTPTRTPAQRARDFEAISRPVTGLTGAMLILLFCLPWNGASSWQLLETLNGLDFVWHLLLLAGGGLLVTIAVCPLPAVFRARLGLGVAALLAVLCAPRLLDGGRGLFVAVAVIGLGALHLAPPRSLASRFSRLLGLVAAGAGLLVGARAILFEKGADTAMLVLGGFAPLLLTGLSLLDLRRAKRNAKTLALIVAWLVWAPTLLVVGGAEGLDATTKIDGAIALLLSTATAALHLASLLSWSTQKELFSRKALH
jgi:hypothetical protein